MNRWIIVAITMHGTDVLLNWSEDLNEFIDCLTGEDVGLVVPSGIGRGVFHVSDVKVYSEHDDGSSDDFTVEGSWMKVFDYDAAFDDLSRPSPPTDGPKGQDGQEGGGFGAQHP